MNELTGRVIEVQRTSTTVQLQDGTLLYATVRGEFHASKLYPRVGDYVRLSLITASEEAQAVIEEIVPRHSVIERFNETDGRSEVLVANVDLIVVVMGLDGDFNLSRLERYLALARSSDITALVVLNKADVTEQLTEQLTEVMAVVGDTQVCVTSATSGMGLQELRSYITAQTTAVLLGSSGAGKSTITNWLLGTNQQAVTDVRADDSRGRHTTTTRQLFTLPGGGYLIDTPGMRELALVDSDDADDNLIQQVTALASDCQFRNCDHDKSDGCAVKAAVESGELSQRAWQNYLKLTREQEWLAQKGAVNKTRHAAQHKKRTAQAKAAQARRRLLRG